MQYSTIIVFAIRFIQGLAEVCQRFFKFGIHGLWIFFFNFKDLRLELSLINCRVCVSQRWVQFCRRGPRCRSGQESLDSHIQVKIGKLIIRTDIILVPLKTFRQWIDLCDILRPITSMTLTLSSVCLSSGVYLSTTLASVVTGVATCYISWNAGLLIYGNRHSHEWEEFLSARVH